MEPNVIPLWFIAMIIVIGLWSLPWKGIALWKSAQRKDILWFIVFLIFNTVAILEILYIFIFSKKKKEIKEEE